ncbi:hypothetical protein [Methylobacterium sp. OAE515]|uniref:hypothetical protein n=1 Tax=Methylobacterium sp. OAE515 TaxID=2817895 RepID=UPI00178B220F
MTDAKRLMLLGCACRRAAAAFAIHASRLAAEIVRGERLDSSEPDESAHRALELEAAAQVLQDLSQDAELLALLPHRARFTDLARMAEAMGRGAVFVPTYPAEVVVAVEQDAAPGSMSLVQRLSRAAHRLPVFRRAA